MEKQIIEIKGVKMEVDLREATTIETFKVGDKVKVLIKRYSDNYNVYSGIIAGFVMFKELPTIVVAYLETSYNSAELKFTNINSKTEDIEIAAATDFDIPWEKANVLEVMDKAIEKKKEEVRDLEMKKDYFLKCFGKFFSVE
ncbi:MAG: hypothetical protein BWX92_04125 [Deltaproteobacteria bacterium ADurb.Bin135]|nr:MAG: hypothetical protein BWX92_04125 [Deltaproteobacteria bacterium ADurb.Bin135]